MILDVVFNHTAEGNECGPTLSMRGLDNRIYYMLAPGEAFLLTSYAPRGLRSPERLVVQQPQR